MAPNRMQQIQEMIKNEPHDSFLNYALALEHAKIYDIQKAIELIENILIRDKNYLGAYYQLGTYYQQTEQSQKAIDMYKRGIIIAQLQQNNKAIKELKEALMMIEDE